MIADSFSPSAASTSSNTARAAGNASASALPMPTAWLPCPGNTNAAATKSPLRGPCLPEIRAERQCKAPVSQARPGQSSLAFAAQNPYNPRFRSSRPGAERTAAFLAGVTLQDQAVGPVGPSSRVPAIRASSLSEGYLTFSKLVGLCAGQRQQKEGLMPSIRARISRAPGRERAAGRRPDQPVQGDRRRSAAARSPRPNIGA